MPDRTRLTKYLHGGIEGIIAGLLSGAVYLILSFVAAATVFKPLAFSSFKMLLLSNALLCNVHALIPSILISGVVGGALFGFLYVATYQMLPGKTSIHKGLFLGIIY